MVVRASVEIVSGDLAPCVDAQSKGTQKSSHTSSWRIERPNGSVVGSQKPVVSGALVSVVPGNIAFGVDALRESSAHPGSASFERRDRPVGSSQECVRVAIRVRVVSGDLTVLVNAQCYGPTHSTRSIETDETAGMSLQWAQKKECGHAEEQRSTLSCTSSKLTV